MSSFTKGPNFQLRGSHTQPPTEEKLPIVEKLEAEYEVSKHHLRLALRQKTRLEKKLREALLLPSAPAPLGNNFTSTALTLI